MEVAILTILLGAVSELTKISDKVRENKEQCKRLCVDCDRLVELLQNVCSNGVPPKVAPRVVKLAHSLSDLTMTVDELDRRPFLQRVIWRGQVSAKIKEMYRSISEAVEELKLGLAFDVCQAQCESEIARQQDAAEAKACFASLLHSGQDIIERLEVGKQMMEAIVCLGPYLKQLLPDSAEEHRFLETALHALQRRSGPVQHPPDEFTITSLDVVICYNRKLGQGGFTTVYEGLWKGRRVAVKVMDLEKRISPSAIQLELDIWKRLQHPHILEFFGACAIASPPFMVCGYKKHGDAASYLRSTPNADRRQLLYEASLGLVYLHQNGVVHGDLKASNILIDENDKACLCDFGLSQVKSSTCTFNQTTCPVPQMGTARWMAPEHMTLGRTTRRTDVYSFGMTMYEIFTGSPPFADTPESMLLAVICDRQLRPDLPEDLNREAIGLEDHIWTLMRQTWAHAPEDRPDVQEVSRQLKRDVNYSAPARSATGHSLEMPRVESPVTYNEPSLSLNGSSTFHHESEVWPARASTNQRYSAEYSAMPSPNIATRQRGATISTMLTSTEPVPEAYQPYASGSGSSITSKEAVILDSSGSITTDPASSPKSHFRNKLQSLTSSVRLPKTKKSPTQRQNPSEITKAHERLFIMAPPPVPIQPRSQPRTPGKRRSTLASTSHVDSAGYSTSTEQFSSSSVGFTSPPVDTSPYSALRRSNSRKPRSDTAFSATSSTRPSSSLPTLEDREGDLDPSISRRKDFPIVNPRLSYGLQQQTTAQPLLPPPPMAEGVSLPSLEEARGGVAHDEPVEGLPPRVVGPRGVLLDPDTAHAIFPSERFHWLLAKLVVAALFAVLSYNLLSSFNT